MAAVISDTSLKRANILISVLWIIVVMTVLVLGLSFEARNDTERTRLMRDRAKAYWLARAAIERTKYDFAVSKMQPDPETKNKTSFRFEFEQGWAECILEGRASMLSVNTTDPEMWKPVLKLYGIEDQAADEVIDAILDWSDPDDEVRLNGAESEYYMSLSPPYQPRNSAFFSIDELLLVRGITEQMFYGSGGLPGLQDMLTVGRSSTIFDVNTAPKGILMAFLELDGETADQIIARRSEQAFENFNEVVEMLPFGMPEGRTRFGQLNMAGGEFIIKSTGFVYDSPARYTVEEEVRYTGGGSIFVTKSHKDFSLDHVDELPSIEGSENE